MSAYITYRKGFAPVGAIVVRLYRSGGEPRGFIREVAADEGQDEIFPSEELEVETALRLAENKQVTPDQPIYVELTEGIRWNPEWGTLT